MVARRHFSLPGFFFLFSGLLLTKSTLIWLFGKHAIGDEGVRGNETKHEQHLLFLTLVCIVCFSWAL